MDFVRRQAEDLKARAAEAQLAAQAQIDKAAEAAKQTASVMKSRANEVTAQFNTEGGAEPEEMEEVRAPSPSISSPSATQLLPRATSHRHAPPAAGA